MTPDSIRKLFDYNYWAFEQMWSCIMQLTDEQFTEAIDFSSGPLRNHVVHMMSSSRRWLQRLQEQDVSPHLAFDDFSTLQAVKAKWDELRAEALSYIYSLDQNQLEEPVRWTLPQRNQSGVNQRWEILMHTLNHATDHRAQILTLLHIHFHVATVEQDMILYWAEQP